MRVAGRIALVLCVLVLGSCARQVVPNARIPMEELPAFTPKGAVTFVNAQTSEERYDLAGTQYANRRVWTDVAIERARRELAQRGMSVEGPKPKVLKLAIETVETETGWVKVETRIGMKVETGDGYMALYTGRNNFAVMGNYERQVDGAMMRVVAEMLRDPKIIAYLTK